METAYLLLGSNLGDRAGQLARARAAIGERVGAVQRASALYETDPWGLADQPVFYNQALAVATHLPPGELLAALLGIEQWLGRVREVRWAARTIDIDIIFYGNEVVAEPHLAIPHPEMAGRHFVLAPLAEIAAGVRHPVLGQTVAELLASCPDTLHARQVPAGP
jgi:2-amino-4-hydroxy-6-hydroxymethyldihydropteridine diphosphokinase